MSKQTRASHPLYNLLPTEIEGFDSLAELALDMRWSWNHVTDDVWRQHQEMKRVRQLAGASGGYVYSAAVSAARPATDYTARMIPHYDGVAIPLEDARVLWQR